MNKTLVFLVQSWGDTHEVNRIKKISSTIKKIKIYAFNRGVINNDIDLVYDLNLGNIKNKKYLNRALSYLKAVYILLIDIRKNDNVYFIQGTDLLFIFNFAVYFSFKSPKFIYQVSDIRDILSDKNYFSHFIKKVDKKFVLKSSLLVCTSHLFIKHFYYYVQNYLIIENKVIDVLYSKKSQLLPFVKTNNTIVIGYFGIIRCKSSLDFLIQLVRKYECFEVVIRGYFTPELNSYINDINNIPRIHYLGKYTSPIDLQSIYSEIDISWVVYPNINSLNKSLARTNRFYESGYFKKIMICSESTEDGSFATRLGVGLEIDLNDFAKSFKILEYLTISNLKKMHSNYNLVNDSDFKITDDYNGLLSHINNLLS
jgi:succinoglycan biosynthesis protein ExoL